MYSARDSLKDEFVCEVDTAIGTSVHLEYQNVHEEIATTADTESSESYLYTIADVPPGEIL